MTDREGRLTVMFVWALSMWSAALMASDADDHVRKGRVEVSTAASFVNFREGGGGDSSSALSVPLRVGWLVADPLEVEAETLLTVLTGGRDTETALTASGHVLYHFGRKNKVVVPFLLVGGGYGNAIEVFNVAMKADTHMAVLGAGAGLRAFLGDRASFRAEYRFTRYFSQDRGEEADLTTHRVLLGFSVWFR
jgi:opacity protein-like surface antigen